jgi:hypothetical protein
MHDAQGDLYLAFCPGAGETAMSMSMPMPMPMPADGHAHHHHDAGATGTETPRHEVCPYALSAGPALAYATPTLHSPPPRVDAPPAPHYSAFFLPTIDRAQSARAPPIPRST